MVDEAEAEQLGKVPDTPDLFEPNPLLNKFLYPMGDPVLSESCPEGTLSHLKARQEYWCGYLNVKTLQLGPEKKSKDRTWHCYWAQVSDDQLLLYKVETMSSHASTQPPTDKDCPQKHLMQEVDRISLVKAVVGLEYTYKADTKNRRRCLFRITQENGADYLLQASSNGAAVCWSETLRTIAGRYADHTVDEDFIREIAIKRMREGDKKAGKVGKGAAINTPILPKTVSPAPPLDPAVVQLKNVLQKKIDLLYHLRQMEKVYSNQLQPRTPSPEVVPQFYFADDNQACCSSPGEPSTGRNSSVFERREATMLKDYHLIAGAAWSLLNKGEKVIVLQELRTGYYLVKATRNTIIQPNMLETKRNISDSFLVNQANRTTSGHYSEPSSPSNVDTATSTVSILIRQSSDSNIVPSDSFQSTISDDSGIVESSKRASNVSTKEDEGNGETGGVHLENGNGEDGFEPTFKAYSTVSLPTNIYVSKDKNGKLPTPPATGRIANSVSFNTISEHSSSDHVSLPLIGSVPPSVLDCYAEQLFSPTHVKPHSSNMVLQQPPPSSKSPATKKKKSAAKGNRLSLQVDNYLLEEQSPSAKQKSSTLPLNSSISTAGSPVGQKPEKGKRAFKSFFKKRLSTHGKLLSVSSEEGNKEFLSVHEDSLPPDVDRVQSPVYEYTPITNSGQEFRRRGKSFVYTIGGSSSDSDSDDESETSDKSGSSRSRRKHIKSSTPPSDKRSSIASNESSTKDEAMFEISMDDNSPQQKPRATGSDHDIRESPEHNAMEELAVPRRYTRTALKKMKSLPTAIGKDGTVVEGDDKQVHRLSAGEFPSIEISMRAPPLNKRRRVYLDANVQKFGFRLETYGRISSSGDVADTVVYTVTQGSAAFLAGMYPGDVIMEVEGVDVSEKNCNELGNIIASYKKSQQVICLTVKFIDGVRRLDLKRMEQKNQRKNSDRYSTASSEGDSSDSDDKRLSGPPISPVTPGLGRISETTEEEAMIEEETVEDFIPQTVSPSQA